MIKLTLEIFFDEGHGASKENFMKAITNAMNNSPGVSGFKIKEEVN